MRTQSKQPKILSNDFPLLDKSIYWAISTNIPTMQGIDIKTNWQCGTIAVWTQYKQPIQLFKITFYLN